MPGYIVKQPNGRYARFSTICDDFTHIDMTEEEVYEVLLKKANNEANLAAKKAIDQADKRGTNAWDDANRQRRAVHSGNPDFIENVLENG